MKRVLFVVFAALALISMSACAAQDNKEEEPAIKKVTLVLDWTPNTNHTGLYVAQEKGYFAENGLEVKIIQPSESAVLQLVAAGTAQFGIDFQESLTFARDKGMPVVSIGAVLQHNTSVFASPTDRNILSPKDFEGKVYGGWGMDMETATLKYLMEKSGADFSKLEIMTIGDTDFLTAAEMGTIDFAWIYEGWEGISAQLKGVELNKVRFEETELFDYYTPIIVTSEDMIANNSDTVAAFMDAVKKGYDFAVKSPKESADVLLKFAPELDAKLVYASQEYLSPRYIDDAESFGVQKKEVWDRYTAWLYEKGFIDTLVDSNSAFTNEFLQ
ncbi:MAG: ABC transporter substrate-binding protein [Christensenellales bacterium]|jgi:ABC-type nitrate/sulfonate/bicarbonate transport system substrate-binding protein